MLACPLQKAVDAVNPCLLDSDALCVVLALSGHVIGSTVHSSWHMDHLKSEPQSFLLQVEKPGVVNVSKLLVIEETKQGKVIGGNDQVGASKNKMPCFM